jgi:hypothetical protein
VRKKLEEYRKAAEGMGGYYPVKQLDDGFEVKTPATSYLRDVDTFNEMRRRACKLGKLSIRSEWVEPFVWCIGAFQWSKEYNSSENTAEQRGKSCTYVELACAVDILTGGRVGPRNASIAEQKLTCANDCGTLRV